MNIYDLDSKVHDDDDDDDLKFFKKPKRQSLDIGKLDLAKLPVPSKNNDSAQIASPSILSPNLLSKNKDVKMPRETKGIALKEENLGDDFLDTPWKIPSIESAKEYKKREIYRQGSGSICSIKLTDTSELGVGVRLYFQFVKSIGVALFCMSILSIPMIIIASQGQGISEQDRDSLGLFKYTLGNISPKSEYLLNSSLVSQYNLPSNYSSCHDISHIKNNDTCVAVLGYELAFTEVNAILSISEFFQVVIFLIVIWHLKRKLLEFTTSENSSNYVSITSYSIYVTDIPKDTKPEELIRHFSDLYQLEKMDWRNRPPVEDARPVQSCDNTGDVMHLNTWVAECTLFKNIGKLLIDYKQRHQLLKSLLRNRAKMKMYGQNTPHSLGFRPKLYKKAEKKMLSIAKRIDDFSIQQRLKYQNKDKSNDKVKQSKIVPVNRKVETDVNNKQSDYQETTSPQDKMIKNDNNNNEVVLFDLEAGKETIDKGKSGDNSKISDVVSKLDSLVIELPRFQKIVGAFICFEYNESCARCLEDYGRFSTFPFSLAYPSNLRFKGKKLRVLPASEPDQVIWENLEYKEFEKFLFRLRTAFLTFLLILFCFLIILAASNLKASYITQLPTQTLCDKYIPTLYAGVDHYQDSNYINQMTFLRPPKDQRLYLDQNCSTYIENSFYLTYSIYNNSLGEFIPAANYSFDSCIDKYSNITVNGYYSPSNVCPTLTEETYCPCISHDTPKETCSTAECQVSNHHQDLLTKGDCQEFSSNNILSCYCETNVAKLFSISNLFKLFNIISSSSSSLTSSTLTTSNGGSGNSTTVVSESVWKVQDDDYYCSYYYQLYFSSAIVNYGVILLTVAVNQILKILLAYLTKFEGHSTLDKEQSSVLFKLFIATYINMAVIILIARGISINLNKMPPIEKGTYTDFVPAWYGDVGFYLVTTLVISNLPSLGIGLVNFWFIKRFSRFFAYRNINHKKGHSIVMQNDLDELELGKTFLPTTHTAQMLSMLFLTMTFSPGLPAMTFILTFIFYAFFQVDKYLLIRFHRKPPAMDSFLMKQVLSYLPYAAIIRLIFAIAMFSQKDILPDTFPNYSITDISTSVPSMISKYLSFQEYQEYVDKIKVKQFTPIHFVEDRMKHYTTFLFTFLLAVIIIYLIIRQLYRLLPLNFIKQWYIWLYKFSLMDTQFQVKKSVGYIHPFELFMTADPTRLESAPFTGIYYQYLGRKDQPKQKTVLDRISENKFLLFYYLFCGVCNFTNYLLKKTKKKKTIKSYEAADGWEVSDMGLEFEVKVKVWPITAKGTDGIMRMKGQHKRTFEIVGDFRCNSYRLLFIPSYRLAYFSLLHDKEFHSLVKDFEERTKTNEHSEESDSPDKPKKKKFDPLSEEKQFNELKQKIKAASVKPHREEIEDDEAEMPLRKSLKKKRKSLNSGSELDSNIDSKSKSNGDNSISDHMNSSVNGNSAENESEEEDETENTSEVDDDEDSEEDSSEDDESSEEESSEDESSESESSSSGSEGEDEPFQSKV